jgi:hypothetical protein
LGSTHKTYNSEKGVGLKGLTVNTTYILELALALSRNVAFLLALTFTFRLFWSFVRQLPLALQPVLQWNMFGLFTFGVTLTPATIAPVVFLDGRPF